VQRPSLRVAVVGATGLAGQQFLAALANHPWMKLVKLGASERSAGKRYADALREPGGASRWHVVEELDKGFAELMVEDADQMTTDGVDLVFSAVESDAAKVLEPKFAKHVPVISTASAFRYEPDVPIFLPGVNVEHAELIDRQRRNRGWKGFISPGPNCTTVGLAITLKPLAERFGLKLVVMTSLQAVSGAGRSPGVLALDVTDNIVPYISKEEEKVQIEARKILGSYRDGVITPHDALVTCTCTRVNVIDGHTESVFVSLEKKTSVEEAKAALREFGAEFRALQLPSCPAELIHVSEAPDRPQPRLDRERGRGMTTTVGRVREDPALPNGLKYVLLSHNTKMGAAGGAILTAEWLTSKGYIG
jgi:aspartate-semialdehyde dehydrogenase